MNKITVLLLAIIAGILITELFTPSTHAQSLPALDMQQYILNNHMAGDPTPQPNNEALNALTDAIKATTTSLDIASYGLNHPQIVEAIIYAHNSGATVRVVAHGEYSTDSTHHYYPYYQQLRDAGIPVVSSTGAGLMHSKFYIIDGEAVWMGSANNTTTGYHYNSNTIWAISDSRLASLYTCEFEQMYSGSFGSAKTIDCSGTLEYAGGERLTVMFTPTNGNEYENALVSGANSSDTVYGRAFYLTLDRVGTALEQLARRGGSVSLLMDANGFGDGFSFGSEGQKLCNAGVSVGVEVYGGKEHNKYMVFILRSGGAILVNGSPNFSNNARLRNDENVIFIEFPSDAHPLVQETITAFRAVEAVMPAWADCQPQPPEGNIVACEVGEGHDNDHDGYVDWGTGSFGWDFDCREAEKNVCVDGLDNDGDGFKDSNDRGCYLVDYLCPDPPRWLPIEINPDLFTLRWEGVGTFAMYANDKPYGFEEQHLIGITTGNSWDYPRLNNDPVFFMIVGIDNDCIDLTPPRAIGVFEFPFVVE